MAGAEVAGVLVPRALVAMGAHLQIKIIEEILFAPALYWVSDKSCWTADLRWFEIWEAEKVSSNLLVPEDKRQTSHVRLLYLVYTQIQNRA